MADIDELRLGMAGYFEGEMMSVANIHPDMGLITIEDPNQGAVTIDPEDFWVP